MAAGVEVAPVHDVVVLLGEPPDGDVLSESCHSGGNLARLGLALHGSRRDRRSVLLSNNPTTISSRRDDMTIQHYQVPIKILVSAAIAVGGAAPASADPKPIGSDPNPFAALSCSCRETASAGAEALREEIARGIRAGLAAWKPGPLANA